MDTKQCYRCLEMRPLTDYHKHPKMKDGRLNMCKFCKVAESDTWRRANPERFNETRRAREILKKYGLTTEQYDTFLEIQGGVCAGCGNKGDEHHTKVGNVTSTRPLAVDHNHQTGEVRGLLCHQCNLVVGNARDDPVTLRKLADYLESVTDGPS